MKTINLYFDFEFTSLSPDAQPISLGIVSDEQARLYDTRYTKHHLVAVKANMDEFERVGESEIYLKKTGYNEDSQSKSFYAEFSDFQLERCDKWVKENVVEKTSIGAAHLQTGEPITNNGAHYHSRNDTATCMGNTTQIVKWLKMWLKQFSDYNLQFVCDAKSDNGIGLGWLNLIELIRTDNPLSDYVFVDLTKGFKAIIDKDYEHSVLQHKWSASIDGKNVYAVSKINGKKVKLHHFIMGDKPFEEAVIDHKSGNSLDNRKSNMRWCTQSDNKKNARIRSNTSSKYKGVYYNKVRNHFTASIQHNKKPIFLGVFQDELSAAKAYNEKALELFGEFSRINKFNEFPDLPKNICQVVSNLNDLIAFKKGISHKEAFDLDREELIEIQSTLIIDKDSLGEMDIEEFRKTYREIGAVICLGKSNPPVELIPPKHNALFDAQVIKEIYQKLK